MPDGHIRAYQSNTPDLRGVSELNIHTPLCVSPTITTTHEVKIMLNFPYILSKRRSEEGKRIRRQYKNDIGVPYQATKQYQLNESGVCDCVTTFTTDNNIVNLNNNQDMELTYHPNPTKEDLLEYFGQRIRIRKMVPKEAGRLMGLYDEDIEKIEAYPFKTYAERTEAIAKADKKEIARIKRESICKTAQYKLYGNSIVVDQIYHLFRTMFIPNQPENAAPIQKSLFDL